MLASCKKDSSPSSAATKQSGNISILPNIEYEGGTWKRKGFILLDIDHADNKDKRFMVIDVQAAGSADPRFVILKGSQPIDSLATNWPPQVRSVAFGLSSDIIVSAHMRMQTQQVTNGRFTYLYDSLQKFPSSIYTYNYLHNPLYAGAMVGKTPQGRAGFWMPDQSGNSKPIDIIYYFREASYTNVISIGSGSMPLVKMIDGLLFTNDDWKQVDAVMSVEGSYNSHFFFDFDKWMFFSFSDFCPSTWGMPCSGGLQTADYKSMNTLMTWPEGWGKK